MKPPKKKRNKIIELGSGPSLVRIYTINRSDGYPQHTVAWKEGGRRKTRVFANLDEARLIARQQVVRLTNIVEGAGEVSLRDVEIFQHCEAKAREQGVSLTAAVDEWMAARKILNKADLIEAVRFFEANRRDFLPVKSVAEVADEFVRSRAASGMSRAYVKTAEHTTKKFVEVFPVPIGEITVQQIDKYLGGLKGVAPTTKNSRRRIIVTMFSFAKKQGYLHPDRQTAAQLSATYKVPDKEVTIFTPDEMRRILLAANARILPTIALGGFTGIRTAEIGKLRWEDINWDRGYIEVRAKVAKTAARRLVPIPENLKGWLAPWRHETGKIVTLTSVAGALNTTGTKAGIPGGWRQNALRHSFISYRVAETSDVPRTALEAGNSPKMIFRHYREVVDEEAAKAWFSIEPPDGWMPKELPWPVRERIRKAAEQREIDNGNGA
mgnify:CR=1 FL=1